MQLGRGLTMLGNHSQQRTRNNQNDQLNSPSYIWQFFLCPFPISFVFVFLWNNKRTDIDSNVQILKWSLSCWDPLNSTKKGATSTFNPSINQLSFSWSILNICKGSYHGIELNWGYLGFWASLILWIFSVFADCACPDKRISPWFTFQAPDHVQDVFGTILLFLLLCFVVIAAVSFIFACTNGKINYNSMQKN